MKHVRKEHHHGDKFAWQYILFPIFLALCPVAFSSGLSIPPDSAIAVRHGAFRNGLRIAALSYKLSGERIKLSRQKWSDEICTRIPNCQVRFLVDEPIADVTGADIRIVPQRPGITHVPWQLWTRFFDDLHYYLENEPHGWYWRGTDDMYVILDNFVPYFHALTSRYDPTREIVMKAQLTITVGGEMYPHGGSGWILSRAAAAILYAAKELLVETGPPTRSDDVMMAMAISLFNLTIEQVHEPRMSGLDLMGDHLHMIQIGNFSDAPMCCNVSTGDWVDTPRRFRDVIVWHGAAHSSFALVHGDKTFPTIPRNLFLSRQRGDGLQVLCLACEGERVYV
jgi:hypothetical protein